MSTGATIGPGPPRPFSMHGAGQYNSGRGPSINGKQDKKSPDRVYPHIDDLVNVKANFNINSALSHLLQDAETYSKQADAHVDFRRPHLGLQEFLRAYELVAIVIPRHKDYPGLRDRPEMNRAYKDLVRRVNGQVGRFEEVKESIRENNAQSGVQPKSARPAPSLPASLQVASPEHMSAINEQPAQAPTSTTDGGLKREKPAVQRKPTYLLGKSAQHQRAQSEQINRVPTSDTRPVSDLEARFARLRAENQKAKHSKNGNVVMPDPADHVPQRNGQVKPAGPRALPNGTSTPPARPAKVALDLRIPDLPRAPDAIYSPDRSNLESRNAVPPLPTPRASMGDVSRRPSEEVVRRSLEASSIATRSAHKPAPAPIPKALLDATLLQAEEVKAVMSKHKILFVDIRVRNRFDEGHIMSHSIICIEPAIIRNDMSAADLESSLVLSPDDEMTLFQKRKDYDFMVYYDQSSRSNLYADATSDVEEETLRDFSRAVYDFDAYNKLRCPPKLLVGGLDAWVELLGQGALATSHTYNAITPKAPSVRMRPSLRHPTSQTYQSRLALDEEKQWKDKLATPDAGFAGRYPDLQTFEVQLNSPQRPPPPPPSNSMTDQSQFMALQAAELNQYKTPARPPPSFSRPSYRGVSEENHLHLPKSTSTNGYFPEVKTISNISSTGGRVGLYNLGNTCYMNSVIQAFSNTRWFSAYLLEGEFEQRGPPPRKKNEMSPPPQLMTKAVQQLLQYLWTSQYEYVKPQTLKNYIYRVCQFKSSNIPSQEVFGGPMQQDAMEFFSFMLDILDDENNRHRDRPEPPALTKEEELIFQREGYHASITFHYHRWMAAHASILSQKMAIMTMQISQCSSCGWQWPNHAPPKYYLTLNLPQKGKEANLKDILASHYNAQGACTEITEDFSCEKCTKRTGKKVSRKVSESITRLPDTLVFALVRNIWTERGDQAKNEIQVRFPLEDLDMGPYFFGLPEDKKRALNGRSITKYRCYAVVQHHGKAVNEGHYTALIRERSQDGQGRVQQRTKEGKWWRFDDQKVTPRHESETQKASSYLLFYEKIENARD